MRTIPAQNSLTGAFERYAEIMAELLERPDMADRIAANPRLITSFQDDVILLCPLPRLTERLTGLRVPADAVQEEDPGRTESRQPAPRRPDSSTPNIASRRAQPVAYAELRPLSPGDFARFSSTLASVRSPLATFALAPHVIWSDFFEYSWADLDGRLCLFAEYQDGLFMPLPPLGAGSLERSLARAFALMRHRNRGSAVSRVENIAEEEKPEFDTAGVSARQQGSGLSV